MTQQPFFDPWPEPEAEHDEQPEYDIPWMPPRHVVGVTVPLDVEIFTGPDVVVRATRARAFTRGLEVEVETWVRPGSTRPVDDVARIWEQQEPRFGLRLADGTRLGHRPPHAAPDEEAGPSTLAQTSGQGDTLRSSRSWWIHPFPEGESVELVVRWDHLGVPESVATLPLGPLREAATREQVLWDPPPPPGADGGGWFAYGPMSGSAYGSSLAITWDDDEDEDAADDSKATDEEE
ncbi:hypothetical protein [Arthrobacter sp. NEB 688]|uniref:hypothetical protein n=1 Tax=Arthrobacter sp. NEB 688 TaxID=904039 RepID=UPI0015649651|nr:hypothetical protein [Arthrobacter sp. NEB 688]QKE85180.1 hypothetical protein HL663_15370 [Arthrobacter sp. NEB 688]